MAHGPLEFSSSSLSISCASIRLPSLVPAGHSEEPGSGWLLQPGCPAARAPHCLAPGSHGPESPWRALETARAGDRAPLPQGQHVPVAFWVSARCWGTGRCWQQGGPRGRRGLAGPAGTSCSAAVGTAQPWPCLGCFGRAAPRSCPDLPPPARDVRKSVPGCCRAGSGSSWPDPAISRAGTAGGTGAPRVCADGSAPSCLPSRCRLPQALPCYVRLRTGTPGTCRTSVGCAGVAGRSTPLLGAAPGWC